MPTSHDVIHIDASCTVHGVPLKSERNQRAFGKDLYDVASKQQSAGLLEGFEEPYHS